MGTVKHQKKRNSGLLYQFLTRKMSEALIEGNNKRSAQVLRIIKKHFKPGTELYNEFRIVNALMRTTVTTEAVAGSILNEAKAAVRKQDVEKLDKQKSHLIKHVNHSLNDPLFYDQQVSEYRMLATIQTLMNEWRKGENADVGLIAKHEDTLVNWLMQEKNLENDQVLSEHSVGTNRLLMRVLTEKINERYGSALTSKQKEIIREHVWSTANDDRTRITEKLQEIRTQLIESLDEYVQVNSNDSYVVNQLKEVREKLKAEDVSNVTDEVVARFMNYVKLHDELVSSKE